MLSSHRTYIFRHNSATNGPIFKMHTSLESPCKDLSNEPGFIEIGDKSLLSFIVPVAHFRPYLSNGMQFHTLNHYPGVLKPLYIKGKNQIWNRRWWEKWWFLSFYYYTFVMCLYKWAFTAMNQENAQCLHINQVNAHCFEMRNYQNGSELRPCRAVKK